MIEIEYSKNQNWKNRDNVICACCGEVFYEWGLLSHIGKKYKKILVVSYEEKK